MNLEVGSSAQKGNSQEATSADSSPAPPQPFVANNVLIHVGYHKCASSFLQLHVYPYLNQAYVPRNNYPAELVEDLAKDNFDAARFQRWAKKELDAVGVSPPYDWLIFSHEQFSGHPLGYPEPDFEVTGHNLHRMFPSARILIVVREQFSYMRSVYAYRVAIQGSEKRTLDQFIREEGAAGLFDKVRYDRLVGFYCDLFGRDNVLVLPLELIKQNQQEFLRQMSAQMNGLNLQPHKNTVVNPSTNLHGVTSIMRAGNRAFYGSVTALGISGRAYDSGHRFFTKVKRKVTPRLNNFMREGRRLKVDPGIRSRMAPLYEESNARLQHYIDADLRSLGYAMPAPDDSHAHNGAS